MKCFTLALLSVILSISSVSANDVSAMLQQADTLYRGGEYASAEELYYQVLNNNLQSPELFYNLGNTHFKQEEWAQSVWAYKSGLQLEPDNEDLAYNLRVVEQQLVDNITPLPEFVLVTWWKDFAKIMSPTMWGVLTILFLWFLALCVWKFLTVNSSERQRVLLGAGGFLCCALVFFAAGTTASSIAASQEIVVFAATTHVKSEPNSRSSTLFSLHEGTAAQVLTVDADWVEIRIADGNVGWMPASDAKVVGQTHLIDD